MIWILLFIGFGLAASLVATSSGRNSIGWFFIGCITGPMGFILALTLPENEDE